MLTLFVKRLILSILKTRLARDKFCTRFCTSRCEKSEICWICEIAGQRVFKNLRLINYLQNGSSVRILTEEPFFFCGLTLAISISSESICGERNHRDFTSQLSSSRESSFIVFSSR